MHRDEATIAHTEFQRLSCWNNLLPALLFADDKSTLLEWRKRIVERLARLRLTIHDGAQPRPITEGIPFLGFIVFPQRRRLKRRKATNFQRRLKELARQWREGKIPLAKITASVQGWVNHARYGNTVGLRKAILRKIGEND